MNKTVLILNIPGQGKQTKQNKNKKKTALYVSSSNTILFSHNNILMIVMILSYFHTFIIVFEQFYDKL